MNKPNGKKHHHNLGNPSSPSSPEDNADVSGPPDDRANIRNTPKQGIWYEIKKTTSTDRITAFATFIIMIATTAYSVIAHKQWKVMERQTDAAFQQLSTARSSIKIANDALKDARESSKEQSDRAERLTKANEDVAQVSIQSAETFKQSANKSLDATIENFRLEQRAWVNIKEVAFKGYTAGGKQVFIKEGHPVRFQVTYTNTGKTPARILTTKTYMFPMKDGAKPPLQEKAIVGTEDQGFTLFPNGTYISEVVTDNYYAAHLDAFKSRQYVMYVYGMIPYEDVFSQTRWTQYCYYLDPNLSSFNVCPFYNETDKTRKYK